MLNESLKKVTFGLFQHRIGELVILATRHTNPDWTAVIRTRLSANSRAVRVDRGGTCRGNFPNSSAELILPAKSPLRKRKSS